MRARLRGKDHHIWTATSEQDQEQSRVSPATQENRQRSQGAVFHRRDAASGEIAPKKSGPGRAGDTLRRVEMPVTRGYIQMHLVGTAGWCRADMTARGRRGERKAKTL